MEKKYTAFERSTAFTIGLLVGAGGAWLYILGQIFTDLTR